MSEYVLYCPRCGAVHIEFDNDKHYCITCKKQEMINTGHNHGYFLDKYLQEVGKTNQNIINFNFEEYVKKEFAIEQNPLYNEKDVKKREKLEQIVIAKNSKEIGSVQVENIPHCPTCGSTNVEKISGLNKVGSAALFGVFSLGHISKTFRCKNCGMKF